MVVVVVVKMKPRRTMFAALFVSPCCFSMINSQKGFGSKPRIHHQGCDVIRKILSEFRHHVGLVASTILYRKYHSNVDNLMGRSATTYTQPSVLRKA